MYKSPPCVLARAAIGKPGLVAGAMQPRGASDADACAVDSDDASADDATVSKIA